MATILALERLFDAVEATFIADGMIRPVGNVAPSTFGWREPSRQETPGSRIRWVPGDDSSGSIGELGAPKYPGRNPRPLATLGEVFTVYIHGQDPTAPEDERLQWKVTRLLYDAWVRAVYRAAYGTFEILGQEWMIDKNQRRYGTAIRVLASIQAMIPDTPPGQELTWNEITGAGAYVDVDELDHSEQIIVDPYQVVIRE